MENNIIETLTTLLKEFQKYGATENVIGKEMRIGDVSIVPVTRLTLGVGAGGGVNDKKGEEKGSGGGGGLKIEPVAFLVIQKDRVSLLSMGKKGPFDTISEQIPGLLNKWIEKQTTPAKGKENEKAHEKVNEKANE
ncbi:MAG: GerW family sporulation protein [bacterium]